VVLPQLASGVFFLIGRVRIGLLGSIALHASVNFELLVLAGFGEKGFAVAIALLLGKVVIAYKLRKWV
jgi:hypothetical protein